MQKEKIFFLGNFDLFTKKKLIFARAFGTASVQSQSLDQLLVPGVFLRFAFLHHHRWSLQAAWTKSQ